MGYTKPEVAKKNIAKSKRLVAMIGFLKPKG
jgi:hypothetical protein